MPCDLSLGVVSVILACIVDRYEQLLVSVIRIDARFDRIHHCTGFRTADVGSFDTLPYVHFINGFGGKQIVTDRAFLCMCIYICSFEIEWLGQ